ncbi:MAG: hypothetical protein NC080_07585 [Paraprevotella sp.]|nr:hypothetical protein [Paraprevotella sp.]
MSEQLELDLGCELSSDEQERKAADRVAEAISDIADSIVQRASSSSFRKHILELVQSFRVRYGLPDERDVNEIAVVTMAMVVSSIAEEIGLISGVDVVPEDTCGISHQYNPAKLHTAHEGRKSISPDSPVWEGMDTKWKN